MSCVEERLDGSEFEEPKNTDNFLHCIQRHAVDHITDAFVLVEHVIEIHLTPCSLVSFFVLRGDNLDSNLTDNLDLRKYQTNIYICSHNKRILL